MHSLRLTDIENRLVVAKKGWGKKGPTGRLGSADIISFYI